MSDATALNLEEYIRAIPDFPKPGILFRDITPLLQSHEAFGESIRLLAERFRNESIDVIVAAEARGFIFAAPLALELKTSFVPIRKPGKLPGEIHSFSYDLEYGSDTLEMHVDGVTKGQRVLVLDDLLATGGTVQACCELVEKVGAEVVSCAFLIELEGLGGADKIKPRDIFSLVKYSVDE